MLFIGTQFSILYTSMYSPAEAATLTLSVDLSLAELRHSDLCRPPGRARPPSAYHDRRAFAPPAVVPASTSLVLDAAAGTCLTARKTLRLPAVLSAAVHAALLIAMMKIVIVLGANPTSHLTMLRPSRNSKA